MLPVGVQVGPLYTQFVSRQMDWTLSLLPRRGAHGAKLETTLLA